MLNKQIFDLRMRIKVYDQVIAFQIDREHESALEIDDEDEYEHHRTQEKRTKFSFLLEDKVDEYNMLLQTSEINLNIDNNVT